MKKNRNLIVRETHGSYEAICAYLHREAGYRILDLLDKEETPIQSKTAWLLQGIQAWLSVLRHLGQLRKAASVVVIGNYTALFVMLLNRLHLIHPDKVFWWGFFIHSRKTQKVLKLLFGFLHDRNYRFIIFSEWEKELYQERLGLDADYFVPLPYGDWADLGLEEREDAAKPGRFYFAGGYSNRDYAMLLAAWQKTGRKLVIIGSKNNQDLVEYKKTHKDPNIRILLDTPSEVFDRYLRAAKACILPFKADTGASGQTVALRSMRLGKVMISSDITVMRDYILDGETGFLLKDMGRDLAATIERIEADDGCIPAMIKKQDALYRERYSYEVITEKLRGILS